MAAFWLLQALTGVVLAFRWEIDDALVPGPSRPADPAGLGDRIDALELDGSRVVDLWSSSASSRRFDIYYRDAAGADRVMRVDGGGQVLRDGVDGLPFANGGIFNTLTSLHSELLAGDRGRWFVGASGILLVTHLVAGLHVAWPRRGNWRRAFAAKPAGPARARILGWHRLAGLWAAIAVLPLAGAGVMLAFEHEIERELANTLPAPIVAPGPTRIGAGTALAVALERYPGAALSMVAMPSADEPWYLVRVRRPGDLSRNWGTAVVFVGAADGSVLAEHAADAGNAGRTFVRLLHPLHTGQMAGLAGRLIVMCVGMWLATMVVLGLRLRHLRRQAEATALVPSTHRARRVL
jgi:uncharacterized iron-regulated membrane protein